MIEEIIGLLRLLPPLLVPKDEVDPLVEVPRHVLRLDCVSQRRHEGGRVAVGPWGKGNIADSGPTLADAKVDLRQVLKEVALKQLRIHCFVFFNETAKAQMSFTSFSGM